MYWKNKVSAVFIISNFLKIELFKYLTLLYFIFTDENFYLGKVHTISSDFNLKLMLIDVIPVVTFIILFLVYFHKNLQLNFYEKFIFLFFVILLFRLFDLRLLFFYIENFIIKLYLSILFIVIILFFTRNYVKKNTPTDGPSGNKFNG